MYDDACALLPRRIDMDAPFIIVELLLLAIISAVISVTTVSYTGSSVYVSVSEESSDEERTLCAMLHNTSDKVGPQTVTLTVVYESRTASVDEDFVAVPVNLTLSTAAPESCFIVQLVSDNLYELREEFFVNLTSTDPAVNILAANKIIMIIDDDRLLISWERQEYTVREEGSLEVCARLIGTLATNIPVVNVLLVGGTATEGVDYRRLQEILAFDIGGATRHCYTIQLITDIAYEGTKEFQAQLLSIDSDRIEIVPLTRIVLLDYNLIGHQNPQSACKGLDNLINTTRPNSFTCNVSRCESIQCFAFQKSINLTLSPCTRSIFVSSMNENGTVLYSEELHSMPHPQGELNITVQVVTQPSNISDEYYLVSMDAPIGQLASTAIPIVCQPPTTQSIWPSGDSTPKANTGGVPIEGAATIDEEDQATMYEEDQIDEGNQTISPVAIGQRSFSPTLTPSLSPIMIALCLVLSRHR